MTEPSRATAKSRRRRTGLGLRATMLIVLGPAIWLGWRVHLARRQHQAVAAVSAYGGFVRFDWEFVDGKPAPDRSPRAPGWLRRAIGEDYFRDVLEVNMVFATDRRPRPDLIPSDSDALMDRFAAFPRLRHLYLSGDLATDRALATIGTLTSLETLRTWNARFTDAGLAQARSLRNLKVLQLGDTRLGDDALAHLSSMTRLEHLDLGGSPITSAGMAHLEGLKSLKFLAIDRTLVSDAGLDQLRGLTNLAEIRVRGSAITDDGVERFRDAMPRLETVR